jgi:hypothetical protein
VRRAFTLGRFGDYEHHSEVYGDVDICHDGLRTRVDVPRETRKITLVYSKHDGANKFTIEPHGAIRNYPHIIFESFREMNEALYQRGYRYVHVEY